MERKDDELHCPKTDDEVTTNGRDCVQNGVNGRHSKKRKKEKPVTLQKRGLGVAKLEKIMMLDEQNSKGVEMSSPLNTVNNTPQQLPVPDNLLCNRSDSAPLRPPFVTNTRTLQLNYAGPEDGCPTSFFTTNGNGNGRSQMSSEFAYTPEMEISTTFVHNANISNGPNQLSSFPIQLGKQQTSFYSPLTVNYVAANSSSAVLQTEPPSNQSLRGTYRYVQPDEAEKIVAAKRQHLLSPQDLPQPQGLIRSTSLGSQGQGSFATNGNPTLKGLPRSVSKLNLQLRKDTNTEYAMSDCAFPELSPLAATPLLSGLKSKQALSYEDPHQAELPNLDSTIYRVHIQGSNLQGGSNMSANHQQQGHNPTFPQAFNNRQNGQSAASSSHENGDTDDNLDLSLRL